MVMEEVKKKLLAKGGLMEDWNRMMTGELPLEDVSWKDGKLYGQAILELARSCLVKGGLLEYECYDDRKRPQGRAVIVLSDWENFPEGLLQGSHLAASDPYYEWYAQKNLKDGRCLYHLCGEEFNKCKVKLARGDRREVVHIQKWRLVNPVTMIENEYMKGLAVDLVTRLLDGFTPASRVPEPPGVPPQRPLVGQGWGDRVM
jgi:hypothetical protein